MLYAMSLSSILSTPSLAYDKLKTLIGELRGKVRVLETATSFSVRNNQTASTGTSIEPGEFRLLPDLNKMIKYFTGQETTHKADD